MHKTMTVKGFVFLLSLILLVFLGLHLMLKGDLGRKAEQEKALQKELAKLEEEYKDLKGRISFVGSESYIVSAARSDYEYVNAEDIRFEFTNPEALYAYTDEELKTLVDEIAE